MSKNIANIGQKYFFLSCCLKSNMKILSVAISSIETNADAAVTRQASD